MDLVYENNQDLKQEPEIDNDKRFVYPLICDRPIISADTEGKLRLIL